VEAVTTNGALSFRTKGDANEDADAAPVPAELVVGKARLSLPYLGYVVDSLKDRGNFYLFIGLPAALLVLSELYVMTKELRGKGQNGASA
jgi:signal peptidase